MCFRKIIDHCISRSTRVFCALLSVYDYVIADSGRESTFRGIIWRSNHDIHMDDSSTIASVKYIVFDKSIIESTCYNASYPGNTGISACAVEYIVMNMDIFFLISGSRRGIIVENPDSRPIGVIDSIIVDLRYLSIIACSSFRSECPDLLHSSGRKSLLSYRAVLLY